MGGTNLISRKKKVREEMKEGVQSSKRRGDSAYTRKSVIAREEKGP